MTVVSTTTDKPVKQG